MTARAIDTHIVPAQFPAYGGPPRLKTECRRYDHW